MSLTEVDSKFSLDKEWVIKETSENGYSLDSFDAAYTFASFTKKDIRLSFWLTKGTIVSNERESIEESMYNPGIRGKKLFKRDVDQKGALEIILDPRIHTGKGYRSRQKLEKNRARLLLKRKERRARKREEKRAKDTTTKAKPSSSPSPHLSTTGKDFSLNEDWVTKTALENGYMQASGDIGTKMISFTKDDCRLNFWLSTGTIGSYLSHPKQRRTQLFRRDVDQKGALEIILDPRVHTGKGYKTRQQLMKARDRRNVKRQSTSE